jgi:hypothetical protein
MGTLLKKFRVRPNFSARECSNHYQNKVACQILILLNYQTRLLLLSYIYIISDYMGVILVFASAFNFGGGFQVRFKGHLAVSNHFYVGFWILHRISLPGDAHPKEMSRY